jgi:hypothetical protein
MDQNDKAKQARATIDAMRRLPEQLGEVSSDKRIRADQ